MCLGRSPQRCIVLFDKSDHGRHAFAYGFRGRKAPATQLPFEILGLVQASKRLIMDVQFLVQLSRVEYASGMARLGKILADL